MDTLHYVVNDRPTKSMLKSQIKERLTAQFCFLSDEKRKELIEKIGGRHMLTPSIKVQKNIISINARNSSMPVTTIKNSNGSKSDSGSVNKRSKRVRIRDSLLKMDTPEHRKKQ